MIEGSSSLMSFEIYVLASQYGQISQLTTTLQIHRGEKKPLSCHPVRKGWQGDRGIARWARQRQGKSRMIGWGGRKWRDSLKNNNQVQVR